MAPSNRPVTARTMIIISYNQCSKSCPPMKSSRKNMRLMSSPKSNLCTTPLIIVARINEKTMCTMSRPRPKTQKWKIMLNCLMYSIILAMHTAPSSIKLSTSSLITLNTTSCPRQNSRLECYLPSMCPFSNFTVSRSHSSPRILALIFLKLASIAIYPP